MKKPKITPASRAFAQLQKSRVEVDKAAALRAALTLEQRAEYNAMILSFLRAQEKNYGSN